eukprot:SAG31_NODE_3095_length_4682_cov_2.946542_7_plen_213_part_00
MEARAKKLGIPAGTFKYLWPQGPGDSPGRTDFAPVPTDASAINALGLGDNIMSDIHGPAMGGVAKAEQVFSEKATSKWGAMNLETNCGDHTMLRALHEARDLNQFHRYANPALRGRAASFCMERSGFNEGVQHLCKSTPRHSVSICLEKPCACSSLHCMFGSSILTSFLIFLLLYEGFANDQGYAHNSHAQLCVSADGFVSIPPLHDLYRTR